MAENWLEMVEKGQLGRAGWGGYYCCNPLVYPILVSLDVTQRQHE
jgi:hypothetical protein